MQPSLILVFHPEKKEEEREVFRKLHRETTVKNADTFLYILNPMSTGKNKGNFFFLSCPLPFTLRSRMVCHAVASQVIHWTTIRLPPPPKYIAS